MLATIDIYSCRLSGSTSAEHTNSVFGNIRVSAKPFSALKDASSFNCIGIFEHTSRLLKALLCDQGAFFDDKSGDAATAEAINRAKSTCGSKIYLFYAAQQTLQATYAEAKVGCRAEKVKEQAQEQLHDAKNTLQDKNNWQLPGSEPSVWDKVKGVFVPSPPSTLECASETAKVQVCAISGQRNEFAQPHF